MSRMQINQYRLVIESRKLSDYTDTHVPVEVFFQPLSSRQRPATSKSHLITTVTVVKSHSFGFDGMNATRYV